MNTTTTNGLSSWNCSSLINSAAAKTGKTIALSLILIVSLVGNSLIGIIVYKTPNLRKPINFLIANMALSDLLFPIFWLPKRLLDLHFDSWLINGLLGQILCKLHAFLVEASSFVSVLFQLLIVYCTRINMATTRVCCLRICICLRHTKYT